MNTLKIRGHNKIKCIGKFYPYSFNVIVKYFMLSLVKQSSFF